MSPRYVVSSVTGYPITPGAASSSTKSKTIWSVLDSGYCYLPVSAFVAHSPYNSPFGEAGERNARHLAALMNALDLLGPPPPPALSSGNGR
jgi:hypothetical protein